MERTGAVAVECFQVLGCLIAFVAAEPVLGVNIVPFAHGAVAEYFSDDGRGGNGMTAFIALNDGELGDGDIEGEGVDQDIVCRRLELLDRELHSEAGSMVDVDAVDGFGVDGSDGPGDGTLLDTAGKDFAVGRFELFGIVKTTDGFARAQDHGTGYNRTEERAAANLIGTGNEHKSARANIELKRTIADPGSFSEGLITNGRIKNVL